MKAKNQNHTSRRLFQDLLSQKGLVLGATLGTIAQVALTVYLPNFDWECGGRCLISEIN